MASASVKLIQGCSYHYAEYKFVLNQLRIITNEQDIQYFEGRSDFSVTRHVSKPEKTIFVPIENNKEKSADEKSQHKDDFLSADRLKSMKKADLIKLGAKYGLFFDGAELKNDMISDIMEAQNE